MVLEVFRRFCFMFGRILVSKFCFGFCFGLRSGLSSVVLVLFLGEGGLFLLEGWGSFFLFLGVGEEGFIFMGYVVVLMLFSCVVVYVCVGCS